MSRRKLDKIGRATLDDRLATLGPSSRFARPHLGWVKAIRNALGMTAVELSCRMGVSDAAVRALEQSEVAGGARLATLQRAAAAMDCTFVYAFIPNGSLEDTVLRQAKRVLAHQVKRTAQTMSLEDQLSPMPEAAYQEHLALLLESGRIWSEPSPG